MCVCVCTRSYMNSYQTTILEAAYVLCNGESVGLKQFFPSWASCRFVGGVGCEKINN